MRRFTVLLTALFVVLLAGTAYSLTNFWYNGYALDATGQVLPNTTVNVRVSIYNGTTLAYQETHTGVPTDQFASLTVEVGTGTVVVPGLAGITTTANTKIMLETNNGPGWVLTGIASISSVMINTTVVPGNIDLDQHRIIIGDALNNGEALFVGGDMSATNDGSTANFQINSGAVGTAEIADGSILNQDINVNANIAVTKLAAGGANQFLVNNGANAWAGLNINSTLQGNGVGTALGINLANANTWTGQQIFNTANPRTPLAPVVGNDLTNKTYVDAADATKWSITGNSGTTSGTNFIGTTDNVALVFKVNNLEYGRLSTTDNVSFGRGALTSSPSGGANVAYGHNALQLNSTGHTNSAFGVATLNNNTTGQFNTALGGWSLYANVNGSRNVGVGVDALRTNQSGSFNTAVGDGSLLSNVTGSNNTAIGANTNVSAGNLTNVTVLGYGAVATASNQIRLGNASVTSLYSMGATAASSNQPNMYVDPATGQIMQSTTLDRTFGNVVINGTVSGTNNLVLDSESPAAGDISGTYLAGFQIVPGVIVDADINAGAAIAVTKLAAGGANQFLVNNGTNAWAGLNVGASLQGNGVSTPLAINLGNANTWTGQQIFNTANPRTPLAPVIGDDITNKTYVDAEVGKRWGITGNSGLTAGTNFIGTTDAVDLVFKVNNLEYGRLTSSLDNVSLGRGALTSSPTGGANVAYGHNALQLNSSGHTNSAVGYGALNNNTTGQFNTAIGGWAMYGNVSGNRNTAVGIDALRSNTIASNNTAVGDGALRTNTSGAYNTALGTGALLANTTALYNSAVGFEALNSNTTGEQNSAVGFWALKNNTTGLSNTAMGMHSIENNSTGSLNSGFGSYSLYHNTSAWSNTGVGYSALMNNSTGQNNVALGKDAGKGTGGWNYNNSTFIGVESDASANGITNSVALGYQAVATASNQVRLGNSSVTSLYSMGAYNGTTTNQPNMYVAADGQIMRSTSLDRTFGNVVINGTVSGTNNLVLDSESPAAGDISGTYLAGFQIVTGSIIPTDLSSGDYSAAITSGTYSINISGNAGTVTNGVYLGTNPAAGDISGSYTAGFQIVAGTIIPADLSAGTYSIDISGNAGTVTNGVYTSRTISTTAPLSGGGDLSADRTLSISQATTVTDGYLSSADWNTFNSKEPAIAAGTTSQYWRGDKTWQTLDKAAVGLGNVENTALSTWNGSANITTVGTITTGTWNGTAIADAYVDNDLTIVGGTINNTPIGATTRSTGAFTTLDANGDVTLGTDASNNITVNGEFVGSLVPNTDDAYDLGTSTQRWRDLYITGATINMGTDANNVNFGYDGTNVTFDKPLSINGTTLSSTQFNGNASTATTATNIAGGAAGSLPYQTAASSTGMLAPANNGDVLTLAAGVPAWAAPTTFGWGLTGNAGTTAGTNFIGTTDDAELHLDVRNAGTVEQSLRMNTNQAIYRESNIAGITAGNARGAYAVDMQIYRFAATQIAIGDYSTVGGGAANAAIGNYSTVGGGVSNTSGEYATVGGGYYNSASGIYSTVGGGYENTASVQYSTVGGGFQNTASSAHSTVGGGAENTASLQYSTVGGGLQNTASGVRSTVGGGAENTASGTHSTVGGGVGNTAQSYGETVMGVYATIGAGNATSHIATDRLFVVGNGTGPGSRSDALVMLKNGNTTLNGTLTATSFSGPLTGNASTATALQTARDFSITGDVTAAAVSFNGSANVALSSTVASVGGVTAANVASGANAANAATSANTASTIVARDASGNFSAGTITATVIGAIRTETAAYTVAATDGTILVNSAGAVTITLPAVAAVPAGTKYYIKNINTGTVTIDGDGAETIDGAATRDITTQWTSVIIQSNGTAWFVLSSN